MESKSFVFKEMYQRLHDNHDRLPHGAKAQNSFSRSVKETNLGGLPNTLGRPDWNGNGGVGATNDGSNCDTDSPNVGN